MSVDTTAFEGFGGVIFFLGSCVAEHGDTLIVVAATDEEGVTYVLDSPSSFQFLLERHGPRAVVDESDAIEYARLVLALSGRVPFSEHVLTSSQGLPQEITSELASRGITVSAPEAARRGRSYRVVLQTLTAGELRRHAVVIDGESGAIVGASADTLWSSPLIH